MPLKAKEIDLIDQARRFWEWVAGIQHWNSAEGWIARCLVWLILSYLLLLVLRHLLEILAKIAENWKNLGLEVRRSPQKRLQLRRRQQFSKVLLSDLATLAKAESWNDQFFTDLEAEVEAEGGYYASRFDRLINRKSSGVRRLPSLIKAVESTAEQCLLITGEPGSGKSVALRHLANQLAQQAANSKSLHTRIPLYLNLKELPPAPPEGPSADFIREFVLENIRRGDADTAAYVRENWTLYRESGLWFFLFDSFDEIPAVLHAPTGSPAIQQHADAIRQFFQGMTECKGVLASREFKGPDALPWKRFKLLPLAPQKQDELIDNSFLSPEQKMIAMHHAGTARSEFLKNPLFLTLLCRFIKDEGFAPLNDNELLLKHIHRLASREPDYLSKKYSLTPDLLISGAIELSVLFASQRNLSLAPTQDQIMEFLNNWSNRKSELENLIAALIDTKIGRCDVKEARAGDRRFTFAHRRYQEALFVQYLTSDPTYLSPRALLMSAQWRDYAVTLLQTAPPDAVAPLLDEAAIQLGNLAEERKPIPVLKGYGNAGSYFEWTDTRATHLLELLQEGLSKRSQAIPKVLRNSVHSYLIPAWNDGDVYDRLMVLRLGGLLPVDNLRTMVRWAVDRGGPHHWSAAITISAFLPRLPGGTVDWFRKELARRLIRAGTRAEILRLEAAAAKAPINVGASWIIQRARVVRPLFRWLSLNILTQRPFWRAVRADVFVPFAELWQMYLALLSFSLLLAGFVLLIKARFLALIIIPAGAILTFLSVRQVWLYWFLSVGDKLSSRSVFRACKKKLRFVRPVVLRVVRRMGVLLLFGVLIWVFTAWLEIGWYGMPLSVVVPGIILVPPVVIQALMETLRHVLAFRHLSHLVQQPMSEPLAICARSWIELAIWIRIDSQIVFKDVPNVRSLLRYMDAVVEGGRPTGGKSSLEVGSKVLPDIESRISLFAIKRLVKLGEESVSLGERGNRRLDGGKLLGDV